MPEDYITKKYLKQTLDQRFDKFGKIIDKKFDDFALIMKTCFDETHELIASLHLELNLVKQDTEDIRLRLDQKADRFELRALERKVDKHIAEHRKSTR